jgi:hypothetical protein
VNLLKSPLRRTTAAVAGAFIGLAGAVATAAPASAHHPELSGKAACADEGGWNVDWTLTPVAPIDGTLTDVKVSEGGLPLEKIVKGAEFKVNTPITETQHVSSKAKTITLTVTATWVYPDEALAFSKGGNHDGNNGGDNHGGGDHPKAIIKTTDHTVSRPEGCKPDKPTKPEEPTTPPTKPAEPGEPTPILEFDCDSLTIGLDNPEDGIEIPLVLKTSKGETRELTVKPGQKKTEKFSASEGFSVTVAVKGFEDQAETVEYEQPEDCSGQAGGEEGPTLPVTGAAAGGIAGGAGLLLAIGGVLFFMARRRRIKFTA